MVSKKKINSEKVVGFGTIRRCRPFWGYLIIPHEGEVRNKDGLHTTYLDPVGIPTICFGQMWAGLYGESIRLGMVYTGDEIFIRKLMTWKLI